MSEFKNVPEKKNLSPAQQRLRDFMKATENLLTDLEKLVGTKKLEDFLIEEFKSGKGDDNLFSSLISFAQYSNKYKGDGHKLDAKTFTTKEDANKYSNELYGKGIYESVFILYNPIDKNYQIWTSKKENINRIKT